MPTAIASNSFRLESTKGMSTERRLLDHEKLDVYRLAIEFLTFALPILDALPRERRELRSQLERAAMSVPLNIAEGCAKPTPADRARYQGSLEGAPSSAERCSTFAV